MGRLWARRKSLSLRELSQDKTLILLGFFYCNAPSCRSHAANAAQVKTARRYPAEYQFILGYNSAPNPSRPR